MFGVSELTEEENNIFYLNLIENQKKLNLEKKEKFKKQEIKDKEFKEQKLKEQEKIDNQNKIIKNIKQYQSIFEKLQKYNISIYKNNFLERFSIFYKIAEKNLNIIYNLIFNLENNKIKLKSKKNYFNYELNDINRIQKKLFDLKDNLNQIYNNSLKNEYVKNNLEKNFYKNFLYFIYNYINIEQEFLIDLLENKDYILFSKNTNIDLYQAFLSYSPESFISKYI